MNKSYFLKLSLIFSTSPIISAFTPTFNGYELTEISNYGCWCRFDKNMPRHGEPLDHMDKLCFTYFKNVQCLIGDELVQEEFDVYSVNYKIVNNFAVTDRTEIKSLCEIENPEATPAELSVCILHSTFTYDMFMHFFTGLGINVDLKKENGFNFDAECVKPPSTISPNTQIEGQVIQNSKNSSIGASDGKNKFRGNRRNIMNVESASSSSVSCCGEYPNRFPYRPDNSRGCCHGKTYNTDLWKCCEDGTVKVEC